METEKKLEKKFGNVVYTLSIGKSQKGNTFPIHQFVKVWVGKDGTERKGIGFFTSDLKDLEAAINFAKKKEDDWHELDAAH